MKKQIRLMKNRLSARKCRQKKKSYINGLESQIRNLKDEVDRYKQTNKKEKNIENLSNMVSVF
jgi:hypothetical protein